jgi:predicted RND superfamily exporter protein
MNNAGWTDAGARLEKRPLTVVEVLNRRSGLSAALVLLAALAALPLLHRLRVDNSLENWVDRDGTGWRQYREFVERFGSEEFILVIYPLAPALDESFLFDLTDLRLDLEAVEGVRQLFCLSDIYSRFFGYLGPDAFAEDLERSPFYRRFLVSDDGKQGAIWLLLDIEDALDRYSIVRGVESAVARAPVAGPIHLAGSPIVNAALDRASRRSSRTLFPLVFLLSGLVLLLRFRGLHGLLLPYMSVGAGIVVTLGLVAASGRSLDMVTIALPPVVWVLGLSTSIHLLARCRKLLAEGGTLDLAVAQSMDELFAPCLFSALTTALGFASLGASAMQPVREMGLFSAFGVLACFTTNFFLFPTLARLWVTAAPPRGRIPARGFAVLARLDTRYPRLVLAVTAVLAAVSATAAFRIQAESNVIEFFRDDAPVARTYQEVLPGFTGPYSLEILLDPEGSPGSRKTLVGLEELGARLAALPEVAKVLSPADLVKKNHQLSTGSPPENYRLPPGAEDLVFAWEGAVRHLGPELRNLWDHENGTIRLTVLARPMGSNDFRRMEEKIKTLVKVHSDPGWSPRMTGIVDLLVDLQTELIHSQLKSFGLAFVVIGLVIAVLLRSLRYASISLVPNLFPVILAFGAMGAFGIALDPATVMIAAIALGIAVDNTIHFLAHYRREHSRGVGTSSAVERTLNRIAGAITLTSLVAALGFAVLCLSDFLPLVHFGLLTAVTMMAALLGDLVLLPSLLSLVDGRSEARERTSAG